MDNKSKKDILLSKLEKNKHTFEDIFVKLNKEISKQQKYYEDVLKYRKYNFKEMLNNEKDKDSLVYYINSIYEYLKYDVIPFYENSGYYLKIYFKVNDDDSLYLMFKDNSSNQIHLFNVKDWLLKSKYNNVEAKYYINLKDKKINKINLEEIL